MSQIKVNLEEIRRRINAAVKRCGRDPGEVKLIAVGKTKPVELIREAYEAGQKVFGENYVQELKQKAEALAEGDVEWHFIGHLQRNKVKYVVPIIKCIHSLDSIRLVEEIEKRADRKIDCLIEVNLGDEESKTGIEKENVYKLIEALKSMKFLNLKGLMTIPPYDPHPEKSRPYFKQLAKLMVEINNKKVYPFKLTELSMGMTEDFEIAIEEGATMVRVGTAIFGERKLGTGTN